MESRLSSPSATNSVIIENLILLQDTLLYDSGLPSNIPAFSKHLDIRVLIKLCDIVQVFLVSSFFEETNKCLSLNALWLSNINEGLKYFMYNWMWSFVRVGTSITLAPYIKDVNIYCF